MKIFRATVMVVGTCLCVLMALPVLVVVDPSLAADTGIDPQEIVTLLPKDIIPAIRDPAPLLVPAEVVKGVRDRDLVLGVAIGGESRAYSIAFLSWHEIVNDTVSGLPIAVTWSPLCYTGIVYSREIHGQTLTFGVSGKLWANGLIMDDDQTSSLWSHVVGVAIAGRLQGTKLRMLTVTQTDWGTWKQLHPATRVLDPSRSPHQRDYTADPYEGYYASDDTGVTSPRREDARLPPKTLLLGVRLGGAVKAYPFSRLSQELVVNDAVADTPILIVFREKNATGLVFHRRIGEHVLTFVPAEKAPGRLMPLRDEQTGSLWSAFTGRAFEGTMQGQQLEQLPSTYAFWFAWQDYYPETGLYGESTASDSTEETP